MNEWMIVGGGIHGCTIATYLIKNKITTIDKLKIIDPYEEPMLEWKKRTSLIEMEFLRSPSVHHIDVDPYSLQRYARMKKSQERFYGPYKRPSLDLFNEHCDSVLESIDISQAWHMGQVTRLEKANDQWKLLTHNNKVVTGENIVLTMSVNDQLLIPNWANELKDKEPSRVSHIFDRKLDKMSHLEPPLVVVGGGITAAHLSIKLAKRFPGKVTLLTRHSFRVKDFDSEPGWLGPKYLTKFHQVTCYEHRRKMIQEARHKGSVTGELFRMLKKLENSQHLKIVYAEIDSATTSNNGDITISLKESEELICASNVLLATGFNPVAPGKAWLQDLIKEEKLQCAACGYPIVKSSLEWCPHLFVSGPLAELEIGPIARNIAGARHAAERITRSIM
ncbi:MAG: FAD/NAD(P)-binding protein [Bacillota bacterium]